MNIMNALVMNSEVNHDIFQIANTKKRSQKIEGLRFDFALKESI